MTIKTIDTRTPGLAAGHQPIYRQSFDKKAEQRLDYQIIADEAILNGTKNPKGIILQTYGAIDNTGINPGQLAEQGYLVCFVHGHKLADQVKGGGARSTIRDIAYFSSLLGGRKTIQRQIDMLEQEIKQLKADPQPGSEAKIRDYQHKIEKLQTSTLTDSRGNALLEGLLIANDVPVIMTGASQGGELTLDIASNLEPFDCHFGLKSASGGISETAFYNQRYDDSFDAFAAESPWFRKEEYLLHSSGTQHDQNTYGTTASKGRAQKENYLKIHSPIMTTAQKEQDWQAAVAENAKGMEHLSSTFPLDPMANAANIRKPVLLLQGQRDDNTPTIFTAQFAKKLLDTTSVYLDQHYYGTNQVESTTLHRYPAGCDDGYVNAIDRFVSGVKSVHAAAVERTPEDYNAVTQLEQRAAWNRHDMSSHWGDISTLGTLRQAKTIKQQARWQVLSQEEINSIYLAIDAQGKNHLLTQQGQHRLQQALSILGININVHDLQKSEINGANTVYLIPSQHQKILQIHQNMQQPTWGNITPETASSLYEKVNAMSEGAKLAGLDNVHAPNKMNKALEILGFKLNAGDLRSRDDKQGYYLWTKYENYQRIQQIHQQMLIVKQQAQQHQHIALVKKTNNVNLSAMGIAVPTMNIGIDGKQHVISITDHPPIIQQTAIGVLATMNLWNPGSPVSPPVAKELGTSGPYALKTAQEKTAQMNKMAGLIYEMFQKGVDVLAMQEVPPPSSHEFQVLEAELKRLDSKTGFIDINRFKASWQKTRPSGFGTAVLHNPAKIAISCGSAITQTSNTGAINNRGQIYSVTNKQTNLQVNLANLHGDYTAQQQTCDFIRNFDGIALGDMNVDKQVLTSINSPTTLSSVEVPITMVSGNPVQADTADMICDNFSRKVNPTFDPSTMQVPQMAKPNVIAKKISLQVQVPATQAKQHLADFKQFLIQACRNDLIDAKGYIHDLKLSTPKGTTTSNILITNEDVLKGYQQFFQQKKQIKNTASSIYRQVQVPFAQANQHLEDFKQFLIQAGRNDLIDAKGYIHDLKLSTPKGSTTANILITNEDVVKIYRQFHSQQLIKAHCEVLENELKQRIVINHDRKQTKLEAMKRLLQKMTAPGGELTKSDLLALKSNSVVTAGIFSGGLFKNRTDNLINQILEEEEKDNNQGPKIPKTH